MEDVSTPLNAAVEYAKELGWKIVPGFIDEYGAKRPWLNGWSTEASSDEATIRGWWDARPDSIVGVCVGMSQLLVIDVDIHDEHKNGFASMQVLLQRLGRSEAWLDAQTVSSRSGGGGRHYFFKAPDGVDVTKRKIEWLSGVDLLVGGSFVVLPPSPHPHGFYQWMPGAAPWEREVAELSPELLQEIIKSTSAIDVQARMSAHEFQTLLEQGSGGGNRNNDLIRLIGWMRRTVGDSEESRMEIRRRLEEWRDRCDPVYRGAAEDEEFERTWQSGLRMQHDDRFHDWFGDALVNAGFEGETTRDLSLWMEPRIGAQLLADSMERMWLWEGTRWVQDGEKHFQGYAALERWGVIDQFLRATGAEADRLAAAGQERAARRIADWGKKMTERRPMTDAMAMVAGRQGVVDAVWDPNPQLLHFRNGVLDLDTLQLVDHDPSLMPTQQLPWEWSPVGEKPRRWLELLEWMLPGDWETQRYLLAALGTSLYGDNRSKALFILHGDANNGKSALLQTWLQVIGVQTGYGYGGLMPKSVIAETRGEQHPAGLASVLESRVAVMSGEWREGDRLNLEVVKALTGDDLMAARFMRENFRVFQPRVTVWMATNHHVTVREFDESVRTRVKLIELPGVIPEDRRLPSTVARGRLMEEGPAILRLCLQAAWDARAAGGLNAWEPAGMRANLDAILDDQDEIAQFMAGWETFSDDPHWKERCLAGEGTSTDAVYAAFCSEYRTMDKTWTVRKVCQKLGVRATDVPRVRTDFGRARMLPMRRS